MILPGIEYVSTIICSHIFIFVFFVRALFAGHWASNNQ